MSEAKFTKGEWNVKTTGHYFNGDRQYKHEVIANDVGVTCLHDSMANANLIAAAPEMYKALEDAAKELYILIDEVNDQRASHINSTTETETDYYDMETVHNINVLLAKARGES